MSRRVHAEQLEMLVEFVRVLRRKPNLLYNNELDFFRKYLQEDLKAQLSERTEWYDYFDGKPVIDNDDDYEEPAFVIDPDAEVESDVELDETGVIEDHDRHEPEYPVLYDVATDESIAKAELKKSAALSAVAEGRLEDAIDIFTEALKLNPRCSLLYSKRADVFLLMKKPRKAIQDCNRAIECNRQSAAGFQRRGKAYKLIGHFESAYKDFEKAQSLDFDKEIDEMRKQIKPNYDKIVKHNTKWRKIREEESRKKDEADRKAARERDKNRVGPEEGMPDMSIIFNNEKLLEAFKDEGVSKALQDVAMNPSNISNYDGNPKVQAVIRSMTQTFTDIQREREQVREQWRSQGHDVAGPSGTQGKGGAGPSGTQGQGGAGPSGTQGQGGAGPSETQGQGGAGPSGTQGQGGAGPSGTQGQGGTGPSGTQGQGGAGPLGTQGQGGAGPSGTQGQGGAGPSGLEGLEGATAK